VQPAPGGGVTTATGVVLLVCDERRARRQFANVLRHGGFDVKTANDSAAAARLLRAQRFAAAIVTDLAGVDLAAFVHELREQSEVPILAVSAETEEWETVRVLDAGADDHLGVPYRVEELLARLRACMRRFERASEEAPIVTDDFSVYVTDLRFVLADGSEAPLTETEWKVLEVLLRHPGHLVGKSDLLRAVWGPDAVEKTNYVRVHMVSIRRKVEPDPARPRYFVTVPGLGIRFVPSAVAARSSAS
jgi:two-component system, OmpR family, KDP operon response regulator KdpE